MPTREISGIEELQTLAGQEVAVSDWVQVTQERINAFAEATGDHQWIHVDTERCRRESPFGTTIAHGFLTLAMISRFSYDTVPVKQKFAMMINYGLNRVRFINPVRQGANLRAHYLLLKVTTVDGGWQVEWRVTVEIEGETKPACVAETITRLYEKPPGVR